MDMHVDAARRGDQAFGVAHRCRRATEQVLVDAVHDRRIAGLADADDAALFDADVAFYDTQHRVDDDGVGDQHVERPSGAVEASDEADAVAQRLAAAMQAFVAGNRIVMLDLGQQRRIAEAHRIAGGRAIERGIMCTGNLDHGSQAPLKPRSRARLSAACLLTSERCEPSVRLLRP